MRKITQRQEGQLIELSPSAEEELKSSRHYNDDLAPVSVKNRTWKTRDVAVLWFGLAVSIPALALASSLVALGVSPLLSIINVILGNLIVLIPIQLNAHVGTKYGIPYPIYARLTFGVRGAHLSSVSRSIVGCGWASIQCWVGGGAVAALLGIVIPFFSDRNAIISMPGNDHVVAGQLVGFFLFILSCGWVSYHGMNKIRLVQNIGGPLLILAILGLTVWSAVTIRETGHSVLEIFTVGNNEEIIARNGGFWFIYLAGLTGNIAYWATIALNIPDFSKMARSQKDQFRGQMIGMPLPMALCAIAGALFGLATYYKYGEAHFDPTSIFYFVDNKIAILVCSLGVIIATLTTCVAANIVAPANGWSNLSPRRISYRKGVIITLLISVFVTQPWFIYGSGSSFIFTWLNNYGMVIAPVAAILCGDYFVCKKMRVDIYALYLGNEGRYHYTGGWNWCAIIAWVISVIPPLLGNTVFAYASSVRVTPDFLDMIAANGYFFSFAVAFLVYVLLMKSRLFGGPEEKGYVSQAEHDEITGKVD